MAGRPTKLTPEVQKRVIDALKGGNTRGASAAYAGISISAFHLWMEKGRAGKSGPYMEFVDAVEKAEADAEVRNVAIIQKAAGTTWQAAAWWLERRRADDYARRERQEVRHVDKEGNDAPVSRIVYVNEPQAPPDP